MRAYMWVLGAAALMLGASGCGGSSNASPSDAGGTVDARTATGTPDAKPSGSPDAARASDGGTADARPGSGADAATGVGSPDARTGGGSDAPIAGSPDAPISESPDGSAGAADAPETPPDSQVVIVVPDAPPGPVFHYVMSSIKFGATADEARSFGFDLDGDGKVDNALGATVTAVAGLTGLVVDAMLEAALTAGSVILLDALHADNVTDDPSADWQIFLGDSIPNPDLTSGNGGFTVAATSPTDGILTGSLTAGQFAGGPSQIAIALAFVEGRPPIHLHLIAAHVQTDVTEAGCTGGKLGGGIPETDVHAQLIPGVADILNAYIAAHPGSGGVAIILGFFDGKDGSMKNGMVEAAEIEASAFANLFGPDVDLLDADGQPGHDGVKDSLSLGLGFACTKAVFTEPAP